MPLPIERRRSKLSTMTSTIIFGIQNRYAFLCGACIRFKHQCSAAIDYSHLEIKMFYSSYTFDSFSVLLRIWIRFNVTYFCHCCTFIIVGCMLFCFFSLFLETHAFASTLKTIFDTFNVNAVIFTCLNVNKTNMLLCRRNFNVFLQTTLSWIPRERML